ncbi:MAG: hypothetical protein U1F77_14655 [Kiritimatiellia bacterium]
MSTNARAGSDLRETVRIALALVLCAYGVALIYLSIHPPITFTIGSATLKAGGFKSTPRIFLALWALHALARRRSGREILPLSSRREKAGSLLSLFGLVFAVYIGNNIVMGSGDTKSAQLLSVSLFRHGGIDFDWVVPLLKQRPYWLKVIDGHYLSAFPLGTGFLVLPVQALAALISPDYGELAYMQKLEKVSAGLLAALTVTVCFCFLLRLTDKRRALFLTLLLAFGTNLWVTASQTLWQHGGACLCLVIALYLLARAEEDPRAIRFIGIPMVLAVFCRPLGALWIAPAVVWILLRHPRHIAWLILFALPLAAAAAALHLNVYHSLLGPYASHGSGKSWRTPLAEGLAGNLFSPARGIFVFTPVVFFSLAGLAAGLRTPRLRPLMIVAGVSVAAHLVVISRFSHWWGGHCYGPRFMTEVMPFLLLLILPLLPRLESSRAWKTVFALAIAWSVYTQAAGVYSQRATEWCRTWDIDAHPEHLWSWSHPHWLAWAQESR